MRLWNAVKRLAVELCRLAKSTIRQIGRRQMTYAFAAAGAAAIVIALIVFDASALGMSEPSGVQRASGWAW